MFAYELPVFLKMDKGISLAFIFLLLMKSGGWTQINIQVGYGVSMVNPEVNKTIINDYLIDNEWLSKDHIDLKVLHGIDLGLKYTWSGFALGWIWRNRRGQLGFEGISPVSNSLHKQEIFYSLNAYSLFLETNSRFFGLGASIDWNDLGVKRRYTGLDQKIGVSSQPEWGNRFYLNINFPAGNSNRITLQLSYYLTLQNYDLNPLANSLLNITNANYPKEKWNHFGISLLINNGPQNESP